MKGSSIRKCHYALSIFLLLGISVCPFLMYQEHASAMQNSTSCRGAAFREDVKALYQTNTDEHPQMLVENLPSDTAIGGAARPPGEASNKETSPPYNPKHRTPMRSSGCLNSWENVQRSRREIRENPYQHDPVEQRYPIRDDANRVAVEAESEQKSKRHRIKELEVLIHNLDKPHHYLELGDIYFQKGNLAKAEECYRASLQRDPQDIDARSHMGQCLLRQKRRRRLPPCSTRLRGKSQARLRIFAHGLRRNIANAGRHGKRGRGLETGAGKHNYARARVQLGELYLAAKKRDLAETELQAAVNDDRHAPAFQRQRDRVWIRRAVVALALMGKA